MKLSLWVLLGLGVTGLAFWFVTSPWSPRNAFVQDLIVMFFMAPSVGAHSEVGDRRWCIVGRWQEFEGEGRTNLLRIAGLAAFYIVELINYTRRGLVWHKL